MNCNFSFHVEWNIVFLFPQFAIMLSFQHNYCYTGNRNSCFAAGLSAKITAVRLRRKDVLEQIEEMKILCIQNAKNDKRLTHLWGRVANLRGPITTIYLSYVKSNNAE